MSVERMPTNVDTPPAPRGRPRVLAVLPGLFPSTIIGVGRPLLRLHQARAIELDLKLQNLVDRRAVASADVMVMCRTIDPMIDRICGWARESGVPLVYELDDNLLDIPENIPGVEYLREPKRRAQLIACLRQADLVRTYSVALQEVIQQYNRNVVIASGPLEWAMIPATVPPRDASRIRIVYATSRQQDGIGPMIVRPLRRILDAFPNTEVTVWGPKIDGLSDHPRVRELAVVRNYERFFVRFAAERFDIGLAPLPDEPFYRCKSNNKFREYGACGIAGVYSDMPVYNTSVADGVTGLLARDDEQAWFAALERLVTDAPLREGIQQRAYAAVRERYNEARTDEEWIAHLSTYAARRVGSAASAPGSRPKVKARPFTTAARLVGQASRVSIRSLPSVWKFGPAEMLRRARGHFSGVGLTVWWEIQRWRMERRTSSPK